MTRIAIHTAAVLATLLGLYALWRCLDAVVLLCLSLALGAALRPLVESLSRRGLSHSMAVAAAYALLLGTIGLLVVVPARPLWQEVQNVGDDMLQTYERVATEWPAGNRVQRMIARSLPPPQETRTALGGEQGRNLAETALGITLNAASVAFYLLVVVALSVYWSLDRTRFERLWLSLLPDRVRVPARDIWIAIESEVGAYLRSEGVQSMIAAVLLAAGYWLIGHPYPLLLALAGALVWPLPWVGLLLALAAVQIASFPMLLTDNPSRAAIITLSATLYTCVVLLLLELLVEPRFFNRQRYNMVLMSIIAIGLAHVWGFFGLLLGPPVAVALQVLGTYFMRWRSSPEPAVIEPAALSERVAALQACLVGQEAPPPELASLLERLSGLVVESRGLLRGNPASGYEMTI